MKQGHPLTPLEAIRNFFENTSFTDMLWIIIAIFAGSLVVSLAQTQFRKNRYQIIDIARWGVITSFTFVFFLFILRYRLDFYGFLSFGICFLVSFYMVYIVNQEISKYQRLITTTILIIGGACLFASFIAGEQGIMFGILSGVFQGSSLQLTIITVYKYIKRINENITDEDTYDDENKKLG
ncbi:MAG: hypothetical protein K1X55_18045 [Chitinophagales bacterium]|nr:hypothetical protein [Chitinophagales bacterium]